MFFFCLFFFSYEMYNILILNLIGNMFHCDMFCTLLSQLCVEQASCSWPFFFFFCILPLFMNLVFLPNTDLVVFNCLSNKLMRMIYYKCPLVLLYESLMSSPAAAPLFCTVPLQLDVSKSTWLLHKGEKRLFIMKYFSKYIFKTPLLNDFRNWLIT